jgi:general secretion pathway protein E
MFNRLRIGELLVEMGLVQLDDVEAALDHQRERGGLFGDILVERAACERKHVIAALARQLGYETQESIDIETVDLRLILDLHLRWTRDNGVLPLHVVDDRVVVACADPLDITVCDHLRFVLQKEPVPVFVARDALESAINEAFNRKIRLDGGLTEGLKDAESPTGDDDVPEIEDILVGQESDDEAPVIQFVNSVFVRAVRERASDIHIEPGEQSLFVRFRTDGVLKIVAEPPKRFQASVLARIKIMANMNIAEKRLPQDGRIRIKIAGKDIDIRVATAPTAHGERVTMRLLDKSAMELDLGRTGMSPSVLKVMRRLIRLPHGIIFVSGPTGSGKTTTLYSALSEINDPDKNILTVEDPVEIQLNGISQMQVNPKIDLTFASGLRSYLRHDPDVIMVGEIRDKETAEIAIQASLTGHLVLSTIHTNDAAGVFTRLMDMGVEPFLVASTVLAAHAQRLVRLLCMECREVFSPSDEQLGEVGITREQMVAAGGVVYRAVGCGACLRTGFLGRVGIHELLTVGDEVQRLIIRQSDAGTIRRAGVEAGMVTLREGGAAKVLAGLTTIAEVMRVTQLDEIEQAT